MHPFSKLRCNDCPTAFYGHQCLYAGQYCQPCVHFHTCPVCHTPAYYASLNLFEQEELIDIAQHIAQCNFNDDLLIKELRRCLSYATWFEYSCPVFEACLNALPENEKIIRAYLEDHYKMIHSS